MRSRRWILKSLMLTDEHHYREVQWISSFKISSYRTNHLNTGSSGNIEILGKQNYLFPSGSVIKCFIFFRSISSTNFIRAVSYITSTNSGNNNCHRRETTSPTHLYRTTIVTKHWKGHKGSKYLKSLNWTFFFLLWPISVWLSCSLYLIKKSV